MKKSEWIRGIAFFLTAALVFHILTTIFIPKWYGTWQSTRIVDGFYEMPRDSMDVVLLGSSQTIMGLSAMELYRQYGISAYGFGTEEQPLYATYYWLKEILRYQKPAVAVLDINELIHESNEAAYRKAFDYMKWSKVKWEAVKVHCDENEELSLFGYILPLVHYHSRWDELESSDFEYLVSDKTDPFLGSVALSGTCEIVYGGIPAEPAKQPEDADAQAYEYLQKIIQLCRKEGIELLLVKTPRAGWNAGKHNLVAQIAKEQGLSFLDFNDTDIMEAMGFNYCEDARDGSHLNIYGAEKVGDYLGNYLISHYDLPDCREDDGYLYLEEMLPVYEKQAENTKLRTCNYFQDWLKHLKSRYIVILVSDGPDTVRALPQEVMEALCRMGASMDMLKSGADYGAVLKLKQDTGKEDGSPAGEALAWQYGTGISGLKGILEDGMVYQIQVTLPKGEGASVCSISLDAKEYAAGEEGLHLVVYDPIRQDVIDSIGVDAKTPELLLSR